MGYQEQYGGKKIDGRWALSRVISRNLKLGGIEKC